MLWCYTTRVGAPLRVCNSDIREKERGIKRLRACHWLPQGCKLKQCSHGVSCNWSTQVEGETINSPQSALGQESLLIIHLMINYWVFVLWAESQISSEISREKYSKIMLMVHDARKVVVTCQSQSSPALSMNIVKLTSCFFWRRLESGDWGHEHMFAMFTS